ncbi:LysR family transcriptional regulator, partial [Deltaproteobacteria bacterium OttesenSCG-928-K17]|nr:LysR family transcriptional regulator [Deltaproteobacteria bacterium OttesenSCG-928-K17]
MNISQLKTFVCVVKHGSISKATELIYISQSAISQQIKAMEQSFGVRLLDRSHKGVGLTKAGEVVYKHSLTILNQYQLMMDDLGAAQNISRALRILANPTVNSYALPCVLHDIKTKYPSFSLNIETMASDDLEEKIDSGLGDIGFIVGKPRHKNLKSKKAFSSEVCLVVGACGNKIPDQVRIEEIYKYPLLTLSKKQKTQRIIDQYLSKVHIDVDRLTVPYSLDSIE